ncbi:MAG TPA: tetratricopeptide repeat protein [Gemmataceae bacterium]|nr:tetratricopeptide repeat protein [Gemmataceae bacterium]
MSRRLLYALLALSLLGAAAGVGWWWHDRPARERAQQLAQADQAWQDHNFARAERLLRQLRKEQPETADIELCYARVLRGLGRTQEASSVLLRAVQLGLPEPEGRREYALLEAADDFALAEPVLQRVLHDQPDDAEVWQALASGYVRNHRWLDAERHYTRWLAREPGRTDLVFERGRVRLEDGRFDQAASDFQIVLRAEPGHYRARLLHAHCLLGAARIAEAETELRRCQRLRPQRPEPLIGLANCAQERGDLDQAERLVRQALKLDPASLLGLHLQGSLYLRRRQYQAAVPVFERILRLDPRDQEAHLQLAQALNLLGERDRARQHEVWYERLASHGNGRAKK